MRERLGLEEVMLELRSEGGKEELYDEEDAAEKGVMVSAVVFSSWSLAVTNPPLN